MTTTVDYIDFLLMQRLPASSISKRVNVYRKTRIQAHVSLLHPFPNALTTTAKREFKHPWLEAGPLNHLGGDADLDPWVVNQEPSCYTQASISVDKVPMARGRPAESSGR